MLRAKLNPTSLRDELSETQSILANIGASIESNFISNAIMTLENADMMGMTPNEAQLIAQQHYRRWLKYFAACQSVRFKPWLMPQSFDFKGQLSFLNHALSFIQPKQFYSDTNILIALLYNALQFLCAAAQSLPCKMGTGIVCSNSLLTLSLCFANLSRSYSMERVDRYALTHEDVYIEVGTPSEARGKCKVFEKAKVWLTLGNSLKSITIHFIVSSRVPILRPCKEKPRLSYID